jgi:hypothetical protein
MATYTVGANFDQILLAGDILNCPYSGTYRTVTLPAGKYAFECWGAEGGKDTYSSTSAASGGKGGYSCGNITLSKSTTVYLYCGQQGTQNNTSAFNGGGSAAVQSVRTEVGGGGGGTDIRIGSTSLYARVIVAGGGGGAGRGYDDGKRLFYAGGAGGGTSGVKGAGYSSTYAGGAGTATSGGSGNASGTFGSGGTGGYSGQALSGGGGGGWYGGGGGAAKYEDVGGSSEVILKGYAGGGGGGSGYVYTKSTASKYPSGCLLNSDYYLSDSGTSTGATSFPSTSGGTETGHSGNGYIRITVLSRAGINAFVKTSSGWQEASALFLKTDSGWQEASALIAKTDSGWVTQ